MSECCTDCCTIVCDTNQSFCATGGQKPYNSFSFEVCVSSGQIIGPSSCSEYFDINAWERAISRISTIFNEGNQWHPDTSTITNPIIQREQDKFLSAEEFNRVCDMLLTDNNKDNYKVNQNDVIYGTYFENLENAIGNLQYFNNQCDNCNSGCDGCNAQCGDCGDCCNTSNDD